MRSVTPLRVALVCLGLAALLVAVLVVCTLLGSTGLDLGRALDAALTPNPDREILFGHRLPRVALGAIAGGALAVVGAAFQALLRNPLADPYILGVSGGAALGGTIAIAVGLPGVAGLATASVPLLSFAGGLGSLALVYGLSLRGRRARPHDVLLIGVVFNAFAAAVIMFLKTVVSAQKAQEMLFWLMGTLSMERISTTELALTALLAGLGALSLLLDAGRLNLLTFGDDDARGLGVDVEAVRRRVFVASSLMVGAVVSVTGLIGFVGLVVPHAVRLVVGPDHRILLPASVLVGAAFLPLADLGTRLLFPLLETATPVGVVTAVVGGPTFIWLLRRGRRLADGDAVLG
jgi:iron complex transport system permease protein